MSMNAKDLYEHNQQADNKRNNAQVASIDKWDIMYNQARRYYERYGNLMVTGEEYRELREWLYAMRKRIKSGKLSPKKIKKLEEIGMIENIHVRKWQENYEKAKEYYEKYGKYYAKDKKIYRWVALQKDKYRDGKLSEEQIKLLNEIGALKDRRTKKSEEKRLEGKRSEEKKSTEKWNLMTAQARKYCEQYGNLDVEEEEEDKENNGLYNWLIEMKLACEQGKLTSEKIKELRDIGIGDFIWNDTFRQIKKYYEQSGNLPTNEYSLIWLLTQKRLTQKGKLPKDKVEKLKKIGIDLPENQWESEYNQILKQHDGKSEISDESKKWLDLQRKAFESGELTFRQIRLLRGINFDFGTDKPDKLCNIEELLRQHKGYRAINQYGELAERYIKVRNAILAEIVARKSQEQDRIIATVQVRQSEDEGFVEDEEFIEEVFERMKEYSRKVEGQEINSTNRPSSLEER